MNEWDKDRKTEAWLRYERGRSYNNRLVPNQYNLVNTNIEFFAGNQWINLPMTPAMQRLPKPVFNIIKRVASLFVASLTSTAASVSFDELSYYAAGKLQGMGGADNPPGPAGHPPLHKGGFGGSNEEVDGAEVATAEVQNLLEKFKMDFRIREALFDGAQTGDYCAHFWWDPEAVPYGGAFGPYRGAIQMELVDGINVMFGNPNTPNVEKQPYILIVGRDTTENLREEMRRHRRRRDNPSGPSGATSPYTGEALKRGPRKSPAQRVLWGEDEQRSDGAFTKGGSEGYEACEDVMPDNEYDTQSGVGGKTELEADSENGKALYVYMYEKKKGKGGEVTVHVTKATRSCTIFESVDTGLSRYPIAWGNWEKQKNQYHGRALVTGIIPNQIFINNMMATVMRHLQLMAFPKTVYNASLISQWNNEVGQVIGVQNMAPGQRISDVAYNLQPADMSNQIIVVIDKAVAMTKDCLGATDAQMGNIKPENTSALMVLQSNAEVPLENARAGLYEWLEDVGGILLDMIGTYYGMRPVVRDREFEEVVMGPGGPVLDPMTGMLRTTKVTRRVMEEYDFSRFKNLWFNVRVNAGAATQYSEIAMIQTLDNLRKDGILDIVDYLERVPDKYIPRKAELIQNLRTRAAQEAPVQGGPGGSPAVGGPLSQDKAVAQLPAGLQGKFGHMPASARKSLAQMGGMKV